MAAKQLSTGEAARLLAQDLKDPSITERVLSALVRDWPYALRPPKQGRLLRWEPGHLDSARRELAARRHASVG